MPSNTCSVHRALLQTETSPLAYDRKSGAYTGSITITNVSGQMITGPLTVVVAGLMPLAVLENATGQHGRDPYLRVPLPCDNLLPGASVTVPVTFRKRSFLALGAIRYRVKMHCGAFQPMLQREQGAEGNREQGTGNRAEGRGKREEKGRGERREEGGEKPGREGREEKSPNEVLSLPGIVLVGGHQDADGPARQEPVAPVRRANPIGRLVGYDQVVVSRSGDV